MQRNEKMYLNDKKEAKCIVSGAHVPDLIDAFCFADFSVSTHANSEISRATRQAFALCYLFHRVEKNATR